MCNLNYFCSNRFSTMMVRNSIWDCDDMLLKCFIVIENICWFVHRQSKHLQFIIAESFSAHKILSQKCSLSLLAASYYTALFLDQFDFFGSWCHSHFHGIHCIIMKFLVVLWFNLPSLDFGNPESNLIESTKDLLQVFMQFNITATSCKISSLPISTAQRSCFYHILIPLHAITF